jgi:hypothetical protein
VETDLCAPVEGVHACREAGLDSIDRAAGYCPAQVGRKVEGRADDQL